MRSLRTVGQKPKQRSPCVDNIEALCLKMKDMHPVACDPTVYESVGNKVVPGMKYRLNEGQIHQIRKAMRSRISLIQGPPGK